MRCKKVDGRRRRCSQVPAKMPRPSMAAQMHRLCFNERPRKFRVEIHQIVITRVDLNHEELRNLFAPEFLDEDVQAYTSVESQRKINVELDATFWQLSERKNPIVINAEPRYEYDEEFWNHYNEETAEKIELTYKRLHRLLATVRNEQTAAARR